MIPSVSVTLQAAAARQLPSDRGQSVGGGAKDAHPNGQASGGSDSLLLGVSPASQRCEQREQLPGAAPHRAGEAQYGAHLHQHTRTEGSFIKVKMFSLLFLFNLSRFECGEAQCDH